MRVDKKKSVAKIAKEILKNPLQTQREIAKATGLGKTTVQENIKELANATKDDRIIYLTDRDFELMQKIQKRKFERIEDYEKPVNDNDLNNWDREAKARYTLFRGETTNNEGGLNDVIPNIVINGNTNNSGILE